MEPSGTAKKAPTKRSPGSTSPSRCHARKSTGPPDARRPVATCAIPGNLSRGKPSLHAGQPLREALGHFVAVLVVPQIVQEHRLIEMARLQAVLLGRVDLVEGV